MRDLYELTLAGVGMGLYFASDLWSKVGCRTLSDFYDDLGNRVMS